MSAKELVDDESVEVEPLKPAERLCSEIQLFDLCDLDKCAFKTGKFCNNPDLLEKFELISEENEADLVRYPQNLDDEEENDDLDEFYQDDVDEQDD